MSEPLRQAMCRPKTDTFSEGCHAIIVAGMASKARNLAPLALIGSHFVADNTTFIDGGVQRQNGLWVASPSEQISAIQKHIERVPQAKTVIFSHSLGALAAIQVAESVATDISVIALSPPLLRPTTLLTHPRLLGRIRTTPDGRNYIPSHSFAPQDEGPELAPQEPVPVNIGDTYAEDIYEHSHNFATRAHRLCNSGVLRFVIPDQDWNEPARQYGPDFAGSIMVPGIHSFQAEPAVMAKTMYAICEIATQ